MMMKDVQTIALIAVALVTVVRADDWWNPLINEVRQDKPILAQLTPAVQKSIPAGIQKQLAKVTGKDLLGLRAMAEKLTQNPSSRNDFIKDLNTRAPNVLFLGTEVYKVGREQYEKARKNLSPDAVKFLKNVIAETSAAINEAATLFNKQDVGTKANLKAVFPFIPQLLQSSKNSVQYVSKNF
ncbi:hypothetical protein M3Y97_00158200 [Aphelenchoides bicaudatus]|nr:hypothetical protein M3Y97_00158200 [Aphelenchoides bicaudatus]